MVRTGRRAAVLADLLAEAGLEPAGAGTADHPGAGALPGVLLDIYRVLGGLQDAPTSRPGAWDLVCAGSLVIELDEELHFNRYRARTLLADRAMDLPWREDYLRYCDEREPECLSAGGWGKRWTNASCEKHFTAGPRGDLTEDGAPRWKQRALYDAVKDHFAAASRAVTLVRLSTHDMVGDMELGAVLGEAGRLDSRQLRDLVERRSL